MASWPRLWLTLMSSAVLGDNTGRVKEHLHRLPADFATYGCVKPAVGQRGIQRDQLKCVVNGDAAECAADILRVELLRQRGVYGPGALDLRNAERQLRILLSRRRIKLALCTRARLPLPRPHLGNTPAQLFHGWQ